MNNCAHYTDGSFSNQTISKKIKGGHDNIPAEVLALVWWLHRKKIINLRQMRAWFALREMQQRRQFSAPPSGPIRRRYRLEWCDELIRLCTSKLYKPHLEWIRRDVRALERLGLVKVVNGWSTFPEDWRNVTGFDHDEFVTILLKTPNRNRRVPFPRKTLKAISSANSANVIGYIIGLTLRGVHRTRDRQGYRTDVRSTRAWMMDVMSLSQSGVTRSRQMLREAGWLETMPTHVYLHYSRGSHDRIRPSQPIDWSSITLEGSARPPSPVVLSRDSSIAVHGNSTANNTRTTAKSTATETLCSTRTFSLRENLKNQNLADSTPPKPPTPTPPKPPHRNTRASDPAPSCRSGFLTERADPESEREPEDPVERRRRILASHDPTRPRPGRSSEDRLLDELYPEPPRQPQSPQSHHQSPKRPSDEASDDDHRLRRIHEHHARRIHAADSDPAPIADLFSMQKNKPEGRRQTPKPAVPSISMKKGPQFTPDRPPNLDSIQDSDLSLEDLTRLLALRDQAIARGGGRSKFEGRLGLIAWVGLAHKAVWFGRHPVRMFARMARNEMVDHLREEDELIAISLLREWGEG